MGFMLPGSRAGATYDSESEKLALGIMCLEFPVKYSVKQDLGS